MSQRMTTRAVLLKAAEHIERHGWQQNEYGQNGRPCCAAGAMMQVTNHLSSMRVLTRSFVALVRHLGLKQAPNDLSYNHLVGSIANWNDAPGRTGDEVIAALRAAAAEACNG